MTKVLHISKYYYPFIGGVEQVARDIVLAMKDMGNVEQKLICFNEDSAVGNNVTHKNETVTDTVDGIEVVRCGCFAKIASQSLSFTYAGELKKLIDNFDPDIVLLHYPNPFVTQLLLAHKKKRFKLAVWWHLDITRQKILRKLFHFQNIDMIKRADKIIGATEKHVNESAYTKYFGDKKHVLPFAISEDRLILSEEDEKKAQELREKHKDKLLCFFLGRHVPYKGLEYLIKASAYLDDRFHFIIAGSGPLTEGLKEMAKNDSKIEFVGRVVDGERLSYLKACDVFCFPSITRNEAFGLALAEGLYFGKPAVTFTIKGSGVNVVSLNGITGIECPNCDSKAYAEALKKLADDPSLREEYGRNGRQRILDNFTKEKFSENIKKLTEELIGSDTP